MNGQLSLFDIRDSTSKSRPCEYTFQRYLGQKVKFNSYLHDDSIHVITAIEKYYTILDDGAWVGTPTTIHPVETEAIHESKRPVAKSSRSKVPDQVT